MLRRITDGLGIPALEPLDEEPSLPLYQVLREEYERLHPGTALPEPVWTLEAEGVRADRADDLAREVRAALRRLDERRADPPDPAVRLAGALDAGERAEIAAFADGAADRPTEARVRAILGGAVDRLVHGDPLWRDPAFAAVHPGPYTAGLIAWYDRDAARARAEHRQRINRLLLEVAFAGDLARAFDAQHRAVCELQRGAELPALSLSGGGIRSATFALGVLQTLARRRLLGAFRYLSTVSGGGYIGGWLSAWMAHDGPALVAESLRAGPRQRIDGEPDALRHLRSYGNYLSPRPGALSADTWTLAATYLRNLLLNWLVLVPLLAAVVAVPLVGWHAVARLRAPDGPPWVPALAHLLVVVGLVVGAVAVAFVHASRPGHGDASTVAPRDRGQSAFLRWCLLPLVLAAIALTTAWVHLGAQPGAAFLPLPALRAWPWAFALFGAALHLLGWVLSLTPLFPFGRASWRTMELVAIPFTGALVGAVAYPVARAVHGFLDRDAVTIVGVSGTAMYVWLALPTFIALIMLSGFLYTGLISRWADDPEREWSARFSAWLLIASAGWIGAGGLALAGPELLAWAWAERARWLVYALSGTGALSGIAVALLGGSAKTAGPATQRAKQGGGKRADGESRGRGIALAIAAPIFAAFLLVVLGMAGRWLVARADALLPDRVGGVALAQPSPVLAALVLLALLALCALASAFVRVNKFSLHAMYRARLIRAFLGASRPRGDRRPHPFTGFDDADNLPMHRLWPAAGEAAHPLPPMHIVNVALNLVRGDNLAWQERKAESFTVSPLHAGSLRLGYRRTCLPADIGGMSPAARAASRARRLPIYGGGQEEGITLGTAITISGAAASPNMGYHSSPVVTFLMTLFNARLGWWLGNPGPAGDRTYHLSHPDLALWPFVAEMFGLTDNRHRYVYLSDGGHFENLALYEMVLRRCRVILVSDAGCDPDHSFGDLGAAIRKIRVDLGIPIEFSAEGFADIRPRSAHAAGGRHWAVGAIRYSRVDAPDGAPSPAYDGVLLYVKPALYGVEPRDVCTYAQSSPAFPHESTSDQFFSESQFESYRALGAWEMEQLLDDPAALAEVAKIVGPRGATLAEVLLSLRGAGGVHPPPAGAPGEIARPGPGALPARPREDGRAREKRLSTSA